MSNKMVVTLRYDRVAGPNTTQVKVVLQPIPQARGTILGIVWLGTDEWTRMLREGVDIALEGGKQ